MLSGFVGEFLILSSTFSGVSRGWAIAASLGVILGAAYMLWLVQRIFYGPESELVAVEACQRSALRRTGRCCGPLAVLMLVMGLAPSIWLPAIRTGVHPPQPQDTIVHLRRSRTSIRRKGGPAVNPVPDIYRILPEVVLTLTGVGVMLIDASLPPTCRAVRWAG